MASIIQIVIYLDLLFIADYLKSKATNQGQKTNATISMCKIRTQRCT